MTGYRSRLPCVLDAHGTLTASSAAAWYARIFTKGRHRGPPPYSPRDLVRNFAERDATWVLAAVPIAMLDYQTEADSSDTRIRLARRYAEKGGEFPPGIASYRSAKVRRTAKAWVRDGNHRVLAAALRGDCAVRMLMPEVEFRVLERDTRERRR